MALLRQFRKLMMKLIYLLIALFFLTGFTQIEDRVKVHGDGSATIKRHAVFRDWDALKTLIGKPVTQDMICPQAFDNGWSDCELDGNTINLKATIKKEDSFFSTADGTEVLFKLDRYIEDSMFKPIFEPMNIGLQTNEKNQMVIKQLKEMGFKHKLFIKMPGNITFFLGRKVKGMGDSFELDLMSEQMPANANFADENGHLIISSTGILHNKWFHMVILVIFGCAGILWARRLRS